MDESNELHAYLSGNLTIIYRINSVYPNISWLLQSFSLTAFKSSNFRYLATVRHKMVID